jgi:RNA polymerase sigma factor (sigma-70 family)
MSCPPIDSSDRDTSVDLNRTAIEDLVIERIKAGDSLAAPMIVSYFGDRLLVLAVSGMPTSPVSDGEAVLETALHRGITTFGNFDPTHDSTYSWFSQQVESETDRWVRSHRNALSARNGAAATPSSSRGANPTLRGRVEMALAAIGPKDRVVLALRCWQGLSFRVIAHRLGIKESTARQRFKRALERVELCANGRRGSANRVTHSEEEPSELRSDEVKRIMRVSGSDLFDGDTKQRVWALRSSDYSVSPELRERLIATLRRALRP